jgi:beta-galactosidase/beta-glucuronidase
MPVMNCIVFLILNPIKLDMKHLTCSGTRFVILLLAVFCCGESFPSANAGKPRLLHPADAARISNNMPVLSWKHTDCEYYTVWIDGVRTDSTMAPQNWYIPFPMSYGNHRWKVTAVKGGSETASETFEFTIEDGPLSVMPENSFLLRNDWKVVSSLVTGMDGGGLSQGKTSTTGWQSTSVPATVLSVMVRNGMYPNPYTGLNNMRIPDCNEDFNQVYGLLQYSHIKNKNPWHDPYWYRREFRVPPDYAGKTIWLNLCEINYKAEVWLNGEKLADTSEVVGMERHFRFNVSSVVKHDAENILAIAVYPPDHPGRPAAAPLTPLADPGTNMADGMISKDYTKWDVLGWDWQPAIRDRDMGITEDVYLDATDDIEFDNLYVSSDLPLPDTGFADLTISMDIINHSGQQKEGKVTATISGETNAISLEQAFTVHPTDTLHFVWDKTSMPQLHIENPALWWPNGYGRAALHTLSLHAVTADGDLAARLIRFGIREVETYLGANERVYKINGKEIYCKGGNWVIDMMLNWTAKRYQDEILLTRKANLNLLRVWGPTGIPPDVFFDAADRNGILIWQDFLSDYWGTFRNSPGMRPEVSLFEKATIGIVKKLRNHPSVIIWCGGNEGPNPREDLILNKILPRYDGRDSKHYLKISNGDGLHGGGPYHTLEPKDYFTDPKLSGFSSEIGPSGVPVYESVMKFMPEHPGQWMPDGQMPGRMPDRWIPDHWMPGRFPLDGVWAYHDANDWPGRDRRKFSSYDRIVRSYYGPPDSTSSAGLEDYLDKCQLVNYDVYRACLEAINSQLWEKSSGILLWKSNASWPSITWQLYDWYQKTHAGYYGTRKAAAPICIQFNRDRMKIQVINSTYRDLKQVKIIAAMYDEDLAETWNITKTTDLQENAVTELNETVPLTNSISYLSLKALDEEGRILSDNFYWLSTGNDFTSFSSLNEPGIRITSRKIDRDEKLVRLIIISNTGKTLALMTELKLIDKNTGLEILPSCWSDNFLSLLPGEEKVVTVEVERDDLPDEIGLEYKAFNMKRPVRIEL